MALVVKDRVKETSTTTGTGTYALAGAATNHQAFSAVMANGDTCRYVAVDQANGGWEAGIGTWATGNNLARTTITGSSNSGSAVSWSAGTRDIFIDMTAAVARPMYDSATEFTFSATTGVPVTGGSAIFKASANMPAMAVGDRWRIQMKITDPSSPMSGTLFLANGANAYSCGLAGGAYSGSLIVSRYNALVTTGILNPAISSLGTYMGTTAITLDVFPSSGRLAISAGLAGQMVVGVDTAPLDLTTGTWCVYYSSTGAAYTEVLSCVAYKNPAW